MSTTTATWCIFVITATTEVTTLTIYLNNLLNPLEQERLAKTLSRLRQGNKQNIDLLSPPEERLKCISCTGYSRI
ncbi:hypothetical protein [Proteus mirabilis]|uniref:Putative two-component response-regulatory protein YehT n=1 Tax=Proteus mirabilis TaxID=584 RepID=A0A2X2C8U6_PROMI|nr:hypothetical protein [Proteus mirabilis]MCL8560252.1 hypothetical protein [Proteus mirabilis]MCL8585238.1 hypothetical protein [Proteus mirabilis]MDK3060382.1 hypothetical protein [Proteus mirabilis]MDK7873479.1 hypothetical protein [Proteus mirabilis]MDK8336566.1 hypothetical protein [Proteus mirabilis]